MKKIHPRKKCTLIIGPMWSGKSALLIDILTGYLGTVAAARPSIDTRDPDDVIISRNGSSMHAYRFRSGADLLQQLDEVGKFDLVGIDEAHMMEADALIWLVLELMGRGSRPWPTGSHQVMPDMSRDVNGVGRSDEATRLFRLCWHQLSARLD